MKAIQVFLITAVLLFPPRKVDVVFALAEESEDGDGIYVGRYRALRKLKHMRHHYKHHKAIQDHYARNRYHETYKDHPFMYEFDQDRISDHYHVDVPNYSLDAAITPRPFRNCIPESFRRKSMHKGMRHNNKLKHKHAGGLDHQEQHKKHAQEEGHLSRYNGHEHGASKSKKRRGNGKSSKASKNSGIYYRQRFLEPRVGRFRFGVHGRVVARGGKRTVGRRNHPRESVRSHRQNLPGGKEIAWSEPVTSSEFSPQVLGHKAVRKRTKHHPHASVEAIELASLPLCPNVAPKRRIFGPVPTVAPREPSMTPNTVSNNNGTTVAPTVAEASRETGTQGPTVGGAPVDIPPGTDRILVRSFMDYGFFEPDQAREPTMAEIDSLLTRTGAWYAEQLQMVYPNLDSFEATFVDTTTDVEAEDPVRIDFDANAFFH